MKLHHKNIEKDNYGSITLTPEEPEDMWHVYNLIVVGDTIRASTIRKVTTESATGSTTSNRVRTILTIRVEDIDFDNQACKVNIWMDLGTGYRDGYQGGKSGALLLITTREFSPLQEFFFSYLVTSKGQKHRRKPACKNGSVPYN